MEILSYLAELVKTRKEVGIPGIGTFYKKKSPGRYDAETHAFIPPSYALDFSPEVREHDALAAYVAGKKNISADSANYYIDQFSKTLQSELSANGSAGLGELGLLRQNDQGLTFHPDETASLGFDFYGLPNLKEEAASEAEQPDITTEQPLATKAEESGSEPVAEEPEPGEAQILLEDQNADLSDGMTEFEVIKEDEEEIEEDPEEDEEPVYEEISEIDHHIYQQVTEPPVSIETVENLEEEPAEEIEETASAVEPSPVIVEKPDLVHEPETTPQEPVMEQETIAVPEAEVKEEQAVEQETVAVPEAEVKEEQTVEQEVVAVPEAEVKEEQAVEQETIAVPEAEVEEEQVIEQEVVAVPEAEVKEEQEAVPEKEKQILVRRPDEPTYVTAESQDSGSVWNFYTSNAPNPEATPKDPEERKPISFVIKLLMAVVLIAGIIAALYFLKPELFRQLVSDKNPKRAMTMSSRPDTSRLKSDSTTLADSTSKVTAKPIVPETRAIKDTVQIKPETLPAANSAEKETTLRYEIIAASLANKTEANNFLAQMRKRGIKAKIANLPGKRLKITLGTFSDETTARKELELLKTSTKIPDIYIFPVKHTNTNHK